MRERRKERIEKLIEQELSVDIYNILELSGDIITVKRVILSKDLSQAKVFITALQDNDRAVEILNKKAGHLRFLLARKLNLRYTHRLRFVKDEEEEKERRLDELFEKLRDKEKNS